VEIRTSRALGLGLVVALACAAALESSAMASEYNLKTLPEIGRCVRVGAGAEYRGSHCIRAEPGGRYAWLSGAGAKNKFTLATSFVKLQSAGDVISCFSATAEGEYTGAKSLKLKKLTLTACQQSAKSGEEAFCQNGAGSTNGVVEFQELEGGLGFISHPKKLKVGWDLKPVSGENLATFECGGANIALEKSLGTGIKRELQGSVIGRTVPLHKMITERITSYTLSKSGTQFPEKFEGGVKDTLTTLVETKPGEKNPEATLLIGEVKVKNEEALETLGRCAGTSC
jgi:hypothetical protein